MFRFPYFRAKAPAAPTFVELLPLFLKSRETLNLRPTTIQNYRNFAKLVERRLGAAPVASFTRQDFRALYDCYNYAFASDLAVLIRWALAEDLIRCPDPTYRAMPRAPRMDAIPPTFLTPNEAHRFFAAVHPSYKAAFTLALFAGLRPWEVTRMDWSTISIAERRLTVPAHVSKIRRKRIIEDVPTILWSQLQLHEQHDGPVLPLDSSSDPIWVWIRERRKAARRSHVRLSTDILRHTFATYFCALHQNPARAAKVLGHQDLGMLANHYDGVTTKAAAEDYFHPKPVLALPAPAHVHAIPQP